MIPRRIMETLEKKTLNSGENFNSEYATIFLISLKFFYRMSDGWKHRKQIFPDSFQDDALPICRPESCPGKSAFCASSHQT